VDYRHTEPLSKLVILPMDGSPPIICLKCGSYLVWSTQPHLVYRTPTRVGHTEEQCVCHTEEQCVCHTEEQCVCHTEEQLVSPCHKSFARQTVLASVAPLHPPTPKQEAPISGGNPATEEATPHSTICAAADTRPTGYQEARRLPRKPLGHPKTKDTARSGRAQAQTTRGVYAYACRCCESSRS